MFSRRNFIKSLFGVFFAALLINREAVAPAHKNTIWTNVGKSITFTLPQNAEQLGYRFTFKTIKLKNNDILVSPPSYTIKS